MKAVFLDVGGIIIQIDWATPFRNLGVHDKAEQNRLVELFKRSPLFHEFERGTIEPADFYEGLNEVMQRKHSHDVLQKAWISLIIGELPGSHAIFDFLKGRVPVYALSNTNVVHDTYQVTAFPILKRFDRFFTSYTLGERKPDLGIHTAVQRLTGHAAKDCLFIDDTMENVEAANQAGWQAFRTVNDTAATLQWLKENL